MTSGASNTETHYAAGPSGAGAPTVGRLAVSFAIFAVLLIGMTRVDVANVVKVGVAAAVWAAVEGGFWILRRRRLARVQARAAESYATLHALEQEELKLRVAEAEARGAFDRFEGK